MKLIDFKKDIYSQNGEDGVLEEIFRLIPSKRNWFVDIGAWDGKYFSNTYRFFEKGWNGLEVEANPRKFLKLIKRFVNEPKIQMMLFTVHPNDLDKILSLYDIPKEFELLNIDIDSYDYWVWSNMVVYRPKVIVIESNGWPSHHIQPPIGNYGGRKGASPDALIELGKEKGYTMVCQVGNLIFVKNDLYEKYLRNTYPC